MTETTLELVEETASVREFSPIVHLTCDKCTEDAEGVCRGFCGIVMRGGTGIIRNPLPPNKCTMCIEVNDECEPGLCPYGHPMRGMLV